MVRAATFGCAGQLLALATAFTLMYAILVDVIAQGIGDSGAWRASAAFLLTHTVPQPERHGTNSSTLLQAPDEVRATVVSAVAAIGVFSLLVLVWSVFKCC